jgi:iron complex outermembrane recepter protein
MLKKIIVVAVCAAIPLVVNAAHNQEVDQAITPKVVKENSFKEEADSTLVLGEITTYSEKPAALSARSILSSVDFLGADLIENQNVMNSWELLGQMPGVQLTQFKQGVESGKVSFRGFNGEGEFNAVKLLIDGIPSNTNDGNMRYMDMIFPLELEYIEVVKGTNDPRYGLHNIAGNVNMVTTQGGTYGKVRATYGSFQTKDIQAAGGIDNGNVAQNYFLAWQASDGFREHSDSDKLSFSGKWFFTPDDKNYKVGVTARYYHHDAQEAGYLTIPQSIEDERQSLAHNSTDGGVRLMNQATVNFDWFINDSLSMSSKAYYNKFNDTRWVRFAVTSGQQERYTDERHYGMLATLTWRPKVDFLRDFAIETGLNKEWQENQSSRYSNVNRVRTAQTRDQQFDLDMLGGYVQAIIKPTDNIKIVPAYRIDSISGNFENRLSGVSATTNDYGNIHQPKLSMMYSPNDHYTLYGNWGKTFQIGVGAGAYNLGALADTEPSINVGWETGLKFKPFQKVDGRIAIWKQRAENEVRRNLGGAANDSVNVGETERKGVDLQINYRPNEHWDAWVGYAWQTSEILKADPNQPNTQGKEMDHVPHYLINAGLNYNPTSQWRFGLLARAQGDSYIERTNSTGKYGRYLTFDASANYQWNNHIDLNLQVRNLTDQYYEYVWMNAEPMVGPADGRAGYFSVNFKL